MKVVFLEDNNTVSVGSRAVCRAKRLLEIWDRLGVGERMIDKSVGWNLVRVFPRNQEVYTFDLLPEEGHKAPAIRGDAPLALLDIHHAERAYAADDDLLNSPRLSMPTPYLGSTLNSIDSGDWSGRMQPGTCATDAPIQVDGNDSWMLDQL